MSRTMTSQEQALIKYSTTGHRLVNGWLEPIAIAMIITCGEIQNVLGIHGPVCEIGVHHGRLFILLHLLTQPGELSIGWDLFDNQAENIDQSGQGDYLMVKKNIDLHGCRTEDINLIQVNSLHLNPKRIADECAGAPRFFSVDGGHTADIAYSDVRLASSTLIEGGILIVDDYFNEQWPEVAIGVSRFLNESDCHAIPFAIGGNKYFFTNSTSVAQQYREALLALQDFQVRQTSVLGHPVVVVTPRPYRRLKDSWLQFSGDVASALQSNLRVVANRLGRN